LFHQFLQLASETKPYTSFTQIQIVHLFMSPFIIYSCYLVVRATAWLTVSDRK